jgi:hypothetical protein
MRATGNLQDPYMNQYGPRNPWQSFTKSRNNGSIGNAQFAVSNGLQNLQPYIFLQCQRDKNDTKTYSADNDMDPGKMPSCLEAMTQIEEMLIARACPIMTVFRKHGGQRGHILNLSQDIQQFLYKLLPRVTDIPFLRIKRMGSNSTEAYFRWLKSNNKFFVIDYNISLLPTDGIPDDIVTITTGSDSEQLTEEMPESEDVSQCASTSFIYPNHQILKGKKMPFEPQLTEMIPSIGQP